MTNDSYMTCLRLQSVPQHFTPFPQTQTLLFLLLAPGRVATSVAGSSKVGYSESFSFLYSFYFSIFMSQRNIGMGRLRKTHFKRI